ncbi:hypothetical protein [Serinibacter arcticus]|uniref:Uncharacterized protein n=1 Tax=Serinibacter arcticus TaxID=1655435 RepID=A0A4Z1E5S7_9MICO|nr:hypothetical protein [Serinibacter arcticus]TGO05067.1 hypothetical protein SERN_1071 [Serinibacter arcticus]
MPRTPRALGAVALVLALTGLAACDADSAPDPDASGSAETAPTDSDGDGASATTTHTVEELGIELTLPADFAEQPSELPLTLERADPRAILSVDGFGSPIPLDDYPAREGEEVSTSVIDGVDVLVVENAQLEGLPPDVEANTLLADNGARSFSLIMSGAPDSLAPAWEQLIDGLVLTPDA